MRTYCSSRVVSVVSCLAVVGATAGLSVRANGDVTGAPTGVQATKGSAYVRYYHKRAISLSLDSTRVAVECGDPAARNGALKAAGLDPAGAKLSAIEPWYLVDVPAAGGRTMEQLVSVLASRPGVAFASPVFVDEYGPRWVTRDLIVGFVGAKAPADRDGIALAGAPGKLRTRDYLPNVDRFTPDSKNGFEVLAASNALAQRGDVTFAQPDWVMTGTSNLVPNDNFFPNQWDKQNLGNNDCSNGTPSPGGLAGFDMQCVPAWDITTGSNAIIVAVFDNGTQLNHPDLNLAGGFDATGNGGAGGPINGCDDHGTAVAGCISAIINNNLGVAGVAPGCRVAPCKFNNSNVPCDGMFTMMSSWMVDCLNFAAGISARVTNNSNGFGQDGAIDTAYTTTYAAGMVHFASNGNSGASTIAYPASSPSVNGVASMQRDGTRTSSSQFGPGTDFSSPGVDIATTDRTGSDGYASGDYACVNGTSFASPNAAGVAALILSRRATLTAPEVEQIMQATARDLGPAGYDTGFGWGLVDANAAVRNAALTCPGDITVNNDPNVCGASVAFVVTAAPGETIECVAGAVVITSPAFFPVGMTTVTCTASDGGGPVKMCAFTVTVNDTQNPTVMCPPNVSVPNDPGVCGATLPLNATAGDNCPGATVSYTIGGNPATSPRLFPVGTTTVTARATDASGNMSGTCTYDVRVNDTEAPVVMCSAASATLDLMGQATVTPATFNASATDNCQGPGCAVTLSLSQTMFTCPPVNVPIPITVFATDCHTNVGACPTTITFDDPDCNGNGQADICDILNGVSLDCNHNFIPDECECFWANGPMVDPASAATLNGQLSHLGGAAGPGGQRVADDFFVCEAQIHHVYGFCGWMLTDSPPGLRKARLDFYEDCNGAPALAPFKTYLDPVILSTTPASGGFDLVKYRFDFCDDALWLDGGSGGKTYWVSLVGISLRGADLSYWVAAPGTGNILGSVPVKAEGAYSPVPPSPVWGPWGPISECCIGCVNVAYELRGESCPIIWDNGGPDLGPGKGGSSSMDVVGGVQTRTADDFVVKSCVAQAVCHLDAWIWSNCDPVIGFIEVYENVCGAADPDTNRPAGNLPGSLVHSLSPNRTTATGQTAVIEGVLMSGYHLEFWGPTMPTLAPGRTLWFSAGSRNVGNANGRAYFANAASCDAPCTYVLEPGVARLAVAGAPPVQQAWAPTMRDYAFRIAVRNPVAMIIASPGPVSPSCAVDTDRSGVVDVRDIFEFLNLWFAGCP